MDEVLRQRLAACRGATTQEIAERVGDLDQDVVTFELLLMSAERTDRDHLKWIPFTIRNTLYGDDDLSDWTLRYHADGSFDLKAAVEDEEVEAHVRWERWEDCVRLVNGDVQPMSLFYSRRVSTPIDASASTNWFAAVNFADVPDEQRPGKLLANLRMCGNDQARIDACVAENGLDRILEARAKVTATTMADLGGAELLAGTTLRWQIDGFDTVAELDFAPGSGDWSSKLRKTETITPDEAVVTIWFAGRGPFLEVAASHRQLFDLARTGEAKTLGTEDRIRTYQAAQRKMYGL